MKPTGTSAARLAVVTVLLGVLVVVISQFATAYELEDDDLYDADGLDCAYRRFGFRAEGAEVLVEQWAWLVDGVGLTLSCAVPREHYAEYCDLFDALAAAVDPLALA